MTGRLQLVAIHRFSGSRLPAIRDPRFEQVEVFGRYGRSVKQFGLCGDMPRTDQGRAVVEFDLLEWHVPPLHQRAKHRMRLFHRQRSGGAETER